MRCSVVSLTGWELAPYAGDDLRGRCLRDANTLVPIHEVFAVRSHGAPSTDVQQVSYVVFVSQARLHSTGAPGHFHWLSYPEDSAGVFGKYRDAKLARTSRSQTFTREHRGETRVPAR